jgi:hypothetical protein
MKSNEKEKKLQAMHVPRYKRIKRKNTLFLSVMPNPSASTIEQEPRCNGVDRNETIEQMQVQSNMLIKMW